MICSIVRIVEPGANCSHPVGRIEVEFLAPFTRSLTHIEMRGIVQPRYVSRSEDETRQQAYELCATFNRCRFSDSLGFRYEVEELASEEDPRRAPLKTPQW